MNLTPTIMLFFQDTNKIVEALTIEGVTVAGVLVVACGLLISSLGKKDKVITSTELEITKLWEKLLKEKDEINKKLNTLYIFFCISH